MSREIISISVTPQQKAYIELNISNTSAFFRNCIEKHMIEFDEDSLNSKKEQLTNQLKIIEQNIQEVHERNEKLIKSLKNEEIDFLKEARKIILEKPQNFEPLRKNFNNTYGRQLYRGQFEKLLKQV